MDYNTQREKLVLPEYGRNVQNMVDFAMTIKDRGERQRCANTIIAVMANMFPQQRDMPDFDHMLWDHLAMMSGYQLDIDFPYEVTRPEEGSKKPQRVPYPMSKIRFRHYGHLLEELLDKLKSMEEGPERDRLIELLANQMKKDLFYWNKDALNEDKIADDIARYTDGQVLLDRDKCRFAATVPNNNNPQKPANSRKGRGKK